MSSSPSLLDRTPDQYIQDAKKLRIQSIRCGTDYEPLPPHIPPRHARVAFYDGLWRIRNMQPADICADVPLEPCGGLDLRKVCKIWGLESCAPIDPMRLRVFEGGDPNRLSNVAVKVLSEEDGCIKVIEPTVSYLTQKKRQVHESVSDMIMAFMSLIVLIPLVIQYHIYDLAERHTPLVRMYHNSWRERRQLRRRAKSWTAVFQRLEVDWAALMRLILVLLTLALIIAVMIGSVQIAARQRVRNWTYYGSFSL